MHAAIVAHPAGRLIVETAVHYATGCEGRRDAISSVGVGIALGVQHSNKGSASLRPKRRDRGIVIPCVLYQSEETACVRVSIRDCSSVVGQSRKRQTFKREVNHAGEG